MNDTIMPQPPMYFTDRAREIWLDTYPQLASRFEILNIDLHLFAQYCTTAELCERWYQNINAIGVTIPGQRGRPTPNPAIEQHRKAVQELQRLTDKLGMSPNARMKLEGKRKGDDTDDEFDEFNKH